MTKGYWTTIEAKLLQIVGETFYSIRKDAPIVVTNFFILSPGHQRRNVNLQKGDPVMGDPVMVGRLPLR